MPGVGYVEMAFAASSGRALAAVAFLRPCVLSGPGREKCFLRCTRRATGALEIASARGTESSSFAMCFAGILANIEGEHTEPISGRGFEAHTRRSIKVLPLRNSEVPVTILGPRPRLLELPSRIGRTAWTLSARKSFCSASRQLSCSANLANAVPNDRTILRRARQQSCKSLRGTVLLRSRVLASQAWDGK